MQGKTSSSQVSVMPKGKRPRRDRTHDWQRIKKYTLWLEQNATELLNPIVLKPVIALFIVLAECFAILLSIPVKTPSLLLSGSEL